MVKMLRAYQNNGLVIQAPACEDNISSRGCPRRSLLPIQAGVIMHTGVRITIETAPAFVMRFTVAFDPIPTANGAPASTCADKIMNGGESGRLYQINNVSVT
jgi:hypothetical protein